MCDCETKEDGEVQESAEAFAVLGSKLSWVETRLCTWTEIRGMLGSRR